ncbi:MAG: DNA topoisomerase [Lachnospiraceae bacterium]
MGKNLYIAEKPSVAKEFAKVLHVTGSSQKGYIESAQAVVTWCVGHLVTMSYPEVYDEKLKSWRMETLPFIPDEWKYEVISNVKDQFRVVSGLLNRPDIDTIYVCTDSGREGEYIYRLVAQMAGVKDKIQKRVWIDSQTEEEILRGIETAKDISSYDNLSASAYLRAKEDYLMGINFSRALTLKFGSEISKVTKENYTVISIGRVMTCVLGMVVRREREIRNFVKTNFYRVVGTFALSNHFFEGEWKAIEGSKYFQSPLLYKENGFKKREDAEKLITFLKNEPLMEAVVAAISRKKENKNAPLLFNLAELQNECSRRFKISPDQTLQIAQSLYEKKMITYPRTDARVLSTAAAKVIRNNLAGLQHYEKLQDFVQEVLAGDSWKKLASSRYVNDKQITDHYALVPTGQGLNQLGRLSVLEGYVYELICRRFLSIFYPPAIYQKYSIDLECKKEHFFANFRVLLSEGYLKVAAPNIKADNKKEKKEGEEEQDIKNDPAFIELLNTLKKGTRLSIKDLQVKEGETSPPKRYNSGSMILAMENAGQLIEDEELRAQIKGSGIGTSATRAEILNKLVKIKYLELNKKTQVISPTLLGELIFDTVYASMRQMLNPELTASWEKGLSYVAEGKITEEEYMHKMVDFINRRIEGVRSIQNPSLIQKVYVSTLGACQNKH